MVPSFSLLDASGSPSLVVTARNVSRLCHLSPVGVGRVRISPGGELECLWDTHAGAERGADCASCLLPGPVPLQRCDLESIFTSWRLHCFACKWTEKSDQRYEVIGSVHGCNVGKMLSIILDPWRMGNRSWLL